MTPEFLTEVEEAFSQASRVPPDTREEFLSQTYSDRPDIVREVLSLLRHETDAERFDRSLIAAAAAEMLQDTDNVIGAIVGGRYAAVFSRWRGLPQHPATPSSLLKQRNK